jgi:hypothetical protein
MMSSRQATWATRETLTDRHNRCIIAMADARQAGGGRYGKFDKAF